MLRVTNLPALITQFLLNYLHVAHLLLTKSSFRDRVRDGIFSQQYQKFGFWFVWYQDFEILSSERWCLWKKQPVSLYCLSVLALGRASSCKEFCFKPNVWICVLRYKAPSLKVTEKVEKSLEKTWLVVNLHMAFSMSHTAVSETNVTIKALAGMRY